MVGGGTQGFGWVGNGLASGTVHRPVFLSRGPVGMVFIEVNANLVCYKVNCVSLIETLAHREEGSVF